MNRSGGTWERDLWLCSYVLLAAAPLALVAVAAKPGDRSLPVIVAAGLGFVGLTTMVLQIVTASRVRAFTAPFGVDVLLRFHREIGLAGLALIVGHVVVLLAADPSKLALLDPVDAPWRAKLGVAAVAALAILVATSVWRRRLKLPYEVWRVLHLVFGGAVIAFAFGHVVGVSSYLSIAPMRWLVLGLVIVAAAGIWWLRAARPYASARRPFKLAAIRPERGGAVTLELEPDGHDGLRFEPGQFVWIRRRAFALAENPFSLSSSARRPHAPALTIKAVGDFTSAAAQLTPGMTLLLDGPHGSPRPALPEHGYVLICGGVGITPAMSLLRTLADDDDPRPVTLVYANRRWDDVTFRDELAELEGRIALTTHHVLTSPPPRWRGERGRIDPPLLERVLPGDADWRNVLVCGPERMVDAALDALDELDLPREHVHAERFVSA